MQMRFIGQNYSMGMIKDCVYDIEAIIGDYPINVKIKNSKSDIVYCPYSSLETFLDNWKQI